MHRTSSALTAALTIRTGGDDHLLRVRSGASVIERTDNEAIGRRLREASQDQLLFL